MSIQIQVLGQRGSDNAVLVTVDTGQHVSRLLMDCGENTVSTVPFSESSQIDHVLFSHFHMDHVAGFDTFFRRHYERADRVNHIWGPPGTSELMWHRFRGFTWNLVASRKATWICHDIGNTNVKAARHELDEAFASSYPMQTSSVPERLFEAPGYHVEAITLQHGTPSIGYIVRENERWNVDVTKMRSLGLKPGPWLKNLNTDAVCQIDGVAHDAERLRQLLLVRTPGQSMAFLTDFMAVDDEQKRIARHLHGVETLVCECQYRKDDENLARANFHMTTEWVGKLASLVEPRQLLLTHFSERYTPAQWDEMVTEVQQHFARATAA